ncbi:MAG TPA: pilus assembly protein N-terminal domain-containing protein, partial [Terriglobales bacterium]|nr:pilus assembly protein N-terminal domain-containing protein [Terriglobales bacterium]
LTLLSTAGILRAQAPPATASQGTGPTPQASSLAGAVPANPAPATASRTPSPDPPAAPQQTHLPPLALKLARAVSSSADTANPAGTGQPSTENFQTLHLIVGRSLFLEFPQRLRRVYVSNPTVLDAMTASPTEVVITARSGGASSLVLWTNDGQTQVYTVLSDVDVAGLSHSLAEALPGDHVEVEAQQGRIHLSGVVGSDAAAEEAARLASVYSKEVINSLVVDPRHLPQVQLQVRFAEIDRSKLTAFGINLLGMNANNMGQSSTEQFSPFTFQQNGSTTQAITSDFLNLFYFNVKNGVGATIKDLETKGILQILAEPNLTTISGKPARFLAGGEFPYPMVQPGGIGSVPTITIDFRPYGVKLEFTPWVNSDGTIRLKVAPEVSALDYTNEVVIAGYNLPAISTRKAETEVELNDGESFGISGILDHRITDTLSKMPGIGDIPILGQLFRSRSLNHSTTELVVIVTPKIIDPLKGPGLPAPSTPKMPVPFLEQQTFDQGLPKK